MPDILKENNQNSQFFKVYIIFLYNEKFEIGRRMSVNLLRWKTNGLSLGCAQPAVFKRV